MLYWHHKNMLRGKKLILVIILIQIGIIAILSLGVFERKSDLHATETIPTPIQRSDIVYNPLPDLPNFYELPPDTVLDITTTRFPALGRDSSHNTINSDSLHERYEYSVEKGENTFRILALGDSFTYGLYLDTEENWVELLEDSLNESCLAFDSYEVLNLGVSGYDIKFSLERFKIRGEKYDPDLLLLFVENADFTLMQNEYNALFQKYYPIFLKQAEESGQTTEWAWLEAYGAANQEYNQQYAFETSIDYNMEALHQLHEIANTPLLVFHSSDLSNNIESRLVNFSDNRNVYFARYIGNPADSKYTVSPDDTHPNKAGSVLIANDLQEYLLRSSIVPCE